MPPPTRVHLPPPSADDAAAAPVGDDGDASLYTRFVLRHAPLGGGCSHRQLVTHAELRRARRHRDVWRDPPPVPYRVTERDAGADDDDGGGGADLTLDAAPCVRGRVAPPGALAYTVHTPRGARALRAAADAPLHMPVDELLAVLGDVPDPPLRVRRRRRPASPCPAAVPRGRGGARNVKLWIGDATVAAVALRLAGVLAGLLLLRVLLRCARGRVETKAA